MIKLYCKDCRVFRAHGEHRVSFKKKHKGHALTFIEYEEAP